MSSDNDSNGPTQSFHSLDLFEDDGLSDEDDLIFVSRDKHESPKASKYMEAAAAESPPPRPTKKPRSALPFSKVSPKLAQQPPAHALKKTPDKKQPPMAVNTKNTFVQHRVRNPTLNSDQKHLWSLLGSRQRIRDIHSVVTVCPGMHSRFMVGTSFFIDWARTQPNVICITITGAECIESMLLYLYKRVDTGKKYMILVDVVANLQESEWTKLSQQLLIIRRGYLDHIDPEKCKVVQPPQIALFCDSLPQSAIATMRGVQEVFPILHTNEKE